MQSFGGESAIALYTLGGSHFVDSSEYTRFFALRKEDYRRLKTIDVDLIPGDTLIEEQGNTSN